MVITLQRRIAQFRFVQAARRGDVTEIQKALDKGIDINAVGVQGINALEFASYEGHTDVVRLLLQRGARPGTAIYKAIAGKQTGVVQIFVSLGFKGSGRYGGYKVTPLEMAAELNANDIIMLLKKRGNPP